MGWPTMREAYQVRANVLTALPNLINLLPSYRQWVHVTFPAPHSLWTLPHRDGTAYPASTTTSTTTQQCQGNDATTRPMSPVDDTTLTPRWRAAESWWPSRQPPRHRRATPLHCTSIPPSLPSSWFPNLARLHGSVTWHLHCTCEVYLYHWEMSGIDSGGFSKKLMIR